MYAHEVKIRKKKLFLEMSKLHIYILIHNKIIQQSLYSIHALRKKDTCIECKQKVECAHCHMPSSSVFKQLSSTNFFLCRGGGGGGVGGSEWIYTSNKSPIPNIHVLSCEAVKANAMLLHMATLF